MIFPKMIEYREIGETNISWLKSCSRSAIERDDPERGRLPDGLGEDAGEHEGQQVESAGRPEPRLEARSEDADEDQREREVGDQAGPIPEELDEVAVGDRQDG